MYPQSGTGIWRVSPNNEVGVDAVVVGGSNLARPDVVATKGINLMSADRISIAKKPVVLFTNSDDSTFQLLLSICSDENGYYFVTNQGVFTLTVFGAPPVLVATTVTNEPSASLGRDGVMFNGFLHVAGGDVVKYFASAIWNPGVTSGTLSTSFPIRLCNFVNKVALAVGNGNSVFLYDTSYSLLTTLVLPIQYIVTGTEWRQNNLYVFTRNISGGTAMMFVWNGTGSAAQYGFPVSSDWIYSGCEYDNNIAVITSAGQLLKFNGGGFDELANFPVYYTPYSWSSSSSLINGTGKVGFRGMKAIGKRLLMNIDGSVTVQGSAYPGIYMPQQPSGIWEYTPNNGLVHKAGYCHTKYNTLSVTSVASNRLVLASNHNLQTGDAFYMNNVGSLTGISSQQMYFAVVEGPATLQVSLTVADANAGKMITLGGTAGVATICCDVVSEVGATLVTAPGAIGLFNKNIENAFFGTEILFGGETPNDANTNMYSLMSMGMGRNHSSIVSSRMIQSTPTQQFGQLTMFLNDYLSSFEKVVVKSRKIKNLAYPTQVSSGSVAKVIWTSNTTFTAAAADRDMNSVKIGDEMTVIQGAGSGYTAHVTSITLVGSTFTVVLDESIGSIVNGNQSEVQFDNWVKERTILNTNTKLFQGYANMNIDHASSWIQLKFNMRGRDSSLDKFSLVSSNDNQQI